MARAKVCSLTAAAVLVSSVALVASVAPATSAAAPGTWRVIGADAVGGARLTERAIKGIDPSIEAVQYRKGGEGNVEVCGFLRTERISSSRQARWSAAGRTGSTVIVQFREVGEGKSAFNRLKQAYLNCTPDSFGGTTPADRITVNGTYSETTKQMKLVWAIYTSSSQTETLRAEGLAVRRAGGALIITRSITKDVTALRPKVSKELTSRQFDKYKAAAFS